jgi:hypothetical protein
MMNPMAMNMMGMGMPMMDPRMSMMSGMGMMDPRMSMMSNMGMMNMMNPMAMNMNMGMNPMMLDPRLAMMNPYANMRGSQYSGSVYGGFPGGPGSVTGSRFGGPADDEDDEEDEDDNIPLGRSASTPDLADKNLKQPTPSNSSARDSHSSNNSGSSKSKQSNKEAQ